MIRLVLTLLIFAVSSIYAGDAHIRVAYTCDIKEKFWVYTRVCDDDGFVNYIWPLPNLAEWDDCNNATGVKCTSSPCYQDLHFNDGEDIGGTYELYLEVKTNCATELPKIGMTTFRYPAEGTYDGVPDNGPTYLTWNLQMPQLGKNNTMPVIQRGLD